MAKFSCIHFVLLSLFLSVVNPATAGEKVPLDQVPKNVLEAVKARFPGAELAGAEKEVEGGKTGPFPKRGDSVP